MEHKFNRREALAGLLPAGLFGYSEDDLWKMLKEGNSVVFIRHAQTVAGVGDPPNMKLADCSSQRNLNDEGRRQASALGEAWRRRNLPVGRVMASPWCRCIDTATLAFLRPPAVEPALGNVFGVADRSAAQLAKLRPLVGVRPRRGNTVMVSHGSTIQALTGESLEPAEMLVVQPQGGEQFKVMGRLRVAA
jgi:phosphohistidine phosphatase SixA